MKPIFSWILALLIAALSGNMTNGGEASQAPAPKGYTIKEVGCVGCDATSGIIITKGLDDSKKITERVYNGTHYVSESRIFNDKLVIIGEINSNTKIVNIVEKDTLSLLDSFYCFLPTISPSGRFIIFRKWYPRFGPAELKTDIYLYYDLAASVKENTTVRPLSE